MKNKKNRNFLKISENFCQNTTKILDFLKHLSIIGSVPQFSLILLIDEGSFDPGVF